MARNDPRMQRGLAVARRMQTAWTPQPGSVRAALEDAVAKANQPPVAATIPPEVRRDRAAAELAAAGRRLSADDLAQIERLYLARGWPAVRDALLKAEIVSADALEVATPIVEQHGIAGLGDAVRGRIQAEDVANVQAGAEPQAAALLASFSDADVAEANRILATEGPEGLKARAAELGIHPAVAAVAVQTIAQHGVETARTVGAEHVQTSRARAEAEKASQQTMADAANQTGQLAQWRRSPDFHEAAEGLARQLEANGRIQRPKGMSAADFVLDALRRFDGGRVMDAGRKPFGERWTDEKITQAATELFGGNAEVLRRVVSAYSTARTTDDLGERMAANDAKRRRPEAKPAPRDGVRAAVEAAVEKHGGLKPERVGVGNLLQAQIAVSAGRSIDPTNHARKEVDRYIESANNPAPDTSLRGVIEAAVAAEEEQDETQDDNNGGENHVE